MLSIRLDGWGLLYRPTLTSALSQGFLTPKGNQENPVWENKHSP